MNNLTPRHTWIVCVQGKRQRRVAVEVCRKCAMFEFCVEKKEVKDVSVMHKNKND